MKSKLRFFTLLLCVAFFPAIMCACSKSDTANVIFGDDTNNNVYSIELIEAYEKLTEGKFDEAIEVFSGCKEQAGEPNIAIEIGLGKAYFGAGDYQNAIKTFETACIIDPESYDLPHYLGEAQMMAGDYSASAVTFRLLLGKDPGNKIVIEKIELALRKNKDYAGLYRLYEEIIEGDYEYTNFQIGYYVGKLIEAAQLSKDRSLIISAIEKLKDTPRGYALEVGFKAYEMFISGDEEAARAVIFDADIVEALLESAGRSNCYFGDFSDTGEYEGKGLIIFSSSDISAVCQIYYGEFSGNKPNGAGIGYKGSAGEFVALEGGSVVFKDNTYIEAVWKNGVPDGDVVKTSEYFEYSDDVLQYSRKTIETATYKNRLAQGEVLSENHYYNQNNTQDDNVTIIKHVVTNSRPAPFEVTIDGDTVKVYEAHYRDLTSEPFEINEEECQNCIFIF